MIAADKITKNHIWDEQIESEIIQAIYSSLSLKMAKKHPEDFYEYDEELREVFSPYVD